jgi:hypothetical protein
MFMANYRSMEEDENDGEAPPVVIEGGVVDSIGSEKINGVQYVQLRGGSVKDVDIYIREDVLRRDP